MDRIKVLHVVPHMQIGGINRFVLDLVHFQKTHPEIEVAIYICNSTNPVWKDKAEAEGITLHWDNLKGMDPIPSHFRKFKKISRDYDIIHWHVYNPCQMIFAFPKGKINIFTHHSVLGEGRVKHFTDFLKWNLFLRMCNRKISCNVFNSEYCRSFWQNAGINGKSTLIYNGAIFEDVTFHEWPEDLTSLKGKFIVGTASNLIGWKRVNLLIEAFSLFQEGKNDVALVIAGNGMEKENLERLAASIPGYEKVHFIGFKENVRIYQNAMDICVFPSTTETFGLSALECMHLGKPVLCMKDGGGICEVIQNKDDIIADVQSLSDRLNIYYNKPELREATSSSNRDSCRVFNMKDKAQEYTDLYLSLI